MNARVTVALVLALIGVTLLGAFGVYEFGSDADWAPVLLCAGILCLMGAGVLYLGLSNLITRAGRVQESRVFKLIASGVVVLAGVGGFSTYYVLTTSGAADRPSSMSYDAIPLPEGLTEQEQAEVTSALVAIERVRDRIISGSESIGAVALASAVATGLALVIIWLGLGLTYLLIGVLAALVGVPMAILGGEGAKWLAVGVVWLAASFTALMRALGLVLSGPGPVLAVARNVLAEAARMRLSVVFIVLLVLGLSLLPSMLREDTFLRYRVQTFIQYSVAGSFWIIAILTLFFSVSSVAFEQRDRLIWQTMTKPVASWQYILGKWIGVAGLNLVLLTVCSTASFLFIEYLRTQPEGGASRGRAVLIDAGFSQDRRILETQVLTARVEVQHTPPVTADDPDFLRSVQAFIEEQVRAEPGFDTSEANLAKVREELLKSALQQARAIIPSPNPSAAHHVFFFEGLARARDRDEPLMLHYRVNAGSNMPDILYKMTFSVGGRPGITRDTGLGQRHTFTATPFLYDEAGQTVLLAEVPPDAAAAAVRAGFPLVTTRDVIDEDGVLGIALINGRFVETERGIIFVPNPEIANIPDNGFSVAYEAGSFHANFARVMAVLWLKLVFLSIIAITASTFLSFPVACLVAFGVFLMAEGSGFLERSLEYYGTTDRFGKLDPGQALIYFVGRAIVLTFRTYTELKPTSRLVDGRLIPWSSLGMGAGVLAVWSGILYATAVAVFRRRELATYSGS